jgi:hypothetical protein
MFVLVVVSSEWIGDDGYAREFEHLETLENVL